MLATIAAVLGGKKEDLPHPVLSWDDFVSAVEKMVRQEGTVWCPKRKQAKAWIDIKELKRSYGKKGGCIIA